MIIEIIGPAGAGKSTLAKAVLERVENARLGTFPSFRKAENFLFYVRNSLPVLPAMLQAYFGAKGGYPSSHLMVSMALLNGWHRQLKRQALNENSLILLDQGPVFMLAALSIFGPGVIMSKMYAGWRDRAFRCWAETLDGVIWLDAALPSLVERIRGRGIWHGVKDKTDADAYQFLETYRRAYDWVISRLLENSAALRVQRVDTGKLSLAETVENVVSGLCSNSAGFEDRAAL